MTNLKAEKALVITATDDKNVITVRKKHADVQTAICKYHQRIRCYETQHRNRNQDAVASIEEVYA